MHGRGQLTLQRHFYKSPITAARETKAEIDRFESRGAELTSLIETRQRLDHQHPLLHLADSVTLLTLGAACAWELTSCFSTSTCLRLICLNDFYCCVKWRVAVRSCRATSEASASIAIDNHLSATSDIDCPLMQKHIHFTTVFLHYMALLIQMSHNYRFWTCDSSPGKGRFSTSSSKLR